MTICWCEQLLNSYKVLETTTIAFKLPRWAGNYHTGRTGHLSFTSKCSDFFLCRNVYYGSFYHFHRQIWAKILRTLGKVGPMLSGETRILRKKIIFKQNFELEGTLRHIYTEAHCRISPLCVLSCKTEQKWKWHQPFCIQFSAWKLPRRVPDVAWEQNYVNTISPLCVLSCQ